MSAETLARRAHPTSHRARHILYPVLLVIADGPGAPVLRELLSSTPAVTRCVTTASETEGLETDVVVIGGSFPLVELYEVRAHPHLFDKPIVLFAPGRELPDLDWRSLNATAVTVMQGAAQRLVATVEAFLSLTRRVTGRA